jgi:SAM-dependent methyltransferase
MTAYNRYTPERIFSKAKQYVDRGAVLFAPNVYRQPFYTCPICNYSGPFVKIKTRAHGLCPKCGSFERHRLQKLVLDRIVMEKLIDFAAARCLQFAPDAVTKILRRYCEEVVTADLNPKRGSIKLDMCAMEVDDSTFDVVYASHVLEHIPNDMIALKEIRRVLKPGGIAILPVPAVTDKTIDYDAPKPEEHYHWRLVGHDYYTRYEKFFGSVKLYYSHDFPEKFQTYVCDTVKNMRLDEEVPVCVKAA